MMNRMLQLNFSLALRNGSVVIFFFYFLITPFFVAAQEYPALEWAKLIGSTKDDFSSSIATDASGNVYSAGSFVGTVDFDPGAGVFNITSQGFLTNSDIFVLKLDANGNFLWAAGMGGSSGRGNARGVDVDAAGNVYITGVLNGTIDFDPGPGVFTASAVQADDIFICKLDVDGNFQWVKSFGGFASDIGWAITVDASGNVYTTGEFWGPVDFDPGPAVLNVNSVDRYDVFVLKLDTDGNFGWVKSFGGIQDDSGLAVTLDGAGNVFTTGRWDRMHLKGCCECTSSFLTP